MDKQRRDRLLNFAAGVRLTIDALMQPIALLGNRGAGKTYGGMKLFEAAHALKVQCIAIDIIGKWWGLRLAAGGRRPGLKDVYIFGGKRADFQIHPDKGAFVARVLYERRVHAILDLSLMRKGERRRFITDFAEEFYLLKKQDDAPTSCVIFLEEAHAVAPQTKQTDEMRMLGAIEDLVREGRNAGIGVVILDQRPATVNKNCLALVEVLVVLRTTWGDDREVYKDWMSKKGVRGGLNLDTELPVLKAGHGFIWAPEQGIDTTRITIHPKWTYDSSATVKIGAKTARIGKLAAVDAAALRSAMSEVTEEVAQSDPRALRAEVAKLKAEIARLQKEVQNRGKGMIVDMKAYAKAKRDLGRAIAEAKKLGAQLETVSAKLGTVADGMGAAARAVADGLDTATRMLGAGAAEHANLPPRNGVQPSRVQTASPNRAPRELVLPPNGKRVAVKEYNTSFTESAVTNRGLSEYALHLLRTLVRRLPMRPTKSQLAILAGRSSGSGAFNSALAELKNNLAITVIGGQIDITGSGRAAVGDVGPETSVSTLETWRNALPEYERVLLDALVRHSGNALTKQELAETTGRSATSGAFNSALATLKRNKLIEKMGYGYVASPTLVG